MREVLKQQAIDAYERFEGRKDERKAIQDRLSSERAIEVDSDPRVQVRRALLNRFDGLGLERVLGRSDLLSINFLQLGLRASNAVCRIHVRSLDGRSVAFGTGFLVSPSIMMTNDHLFRSELDDIDLLSRSLAEFDFELDASFDPRESKTFRLEPSQFFYTNKDLDFALIAVRPKAIDGTPLETYGSIRLIPESGKALLDEPVTIVQHPDGADKQIALRDNRIIDLFDDFIWYQTDTRPGSSGSPVFNDQWELVALHHTGVPKVNNNGKILDRDGHVWNPTTSEETINWMANEGVRISSICKHLKSQSWKASERMLLQEIGLELSELSAEAGIEATPRAPVTPLVPLNRVPPITIEELRLRLDDERTTEADIAPYLVLDPVRSEPFAPAFQLNPQLVIDTRFFESDRVVGWANGWSRRRRHRKYRSIPNKNARVKVVSEGDSWFQYPFYLYDLIDHLMDRDEFAIYSLGAGGDELRDIIAEQEYVDGITSENPSHFLISAGGNDLLGEGRLTGFLYPFASGREAADYLNERFEAFEEQIKRQYDRLFSNLIRRFPNLQILCHGYDYAIPQRDRWLGQPMIDLGIIDQTLQADIVRAIIDRFNALVGETAQRYQAVRYIDLRGVVGITSWYDELHPNDLAFGRLASLFADELLR